MKQAQPVVDSGKGTNQLYLCTEMKVLDMAKIESGKMDIQLAEINLQSIGERIERQFMPIARGKNLKFEFQKLGNVDNIRSDRLRIEQVLKNLLSNAFKFTSEGHITLQINTPGPDEHKKLTFNAEQVIAFRVEDTGIGIPKTKQNLIFESYRQADSSTEKKIQWNGPGPYHFQGNS